jgi:hypothetical protein
MRAPSETDASFSAPAGSVDASPNDNVSMTSEHIESVPVPLSVSVSQNVASDKPNRASYASRICDRLHKKTFLRLAIGENAAVKTEQLALAPQAELRELRTAASRIEDGRRDRVPCGGGGCGSAAIPLNSKFGAVGVP